jgi:glyoxylase-like metal-dependent hydrolase (beta-lactamase superfamily II)
VLVTGFPAGSFAANCFLVAPAPGEECVIIDPGQDAEPGIEDLLAKYRLKPIAVLLTHGHIDHMWSVAPVCGAKDIPAYIHPDDRALLTDPAGGLSLLAKQQFLGGMTFGEPDDVKELADGDVITMAGLNFTVGHVPGHTEGSVMFGTEPAAEETVGTLFTGDLLFAGSIGRTDLPGGDHDTMLRSLAKALELPDATLVLPGHGPQTTIGAERATNPFLTGLSRPAQKGL